MASCYIVCPRNRGYLGFRYDVEDTASFKDKLLSISNYRDFIKVFDVIDSKEFDILSDEETVNDSFNESDVNSLFILKDDGWYCHKKGSDEYIQLTVKMNDYEMLREEFDKARAEYLAFMKAYKKDQKLSLYTNILLIALVVAFFIISNFK